MIYLERNEPTAEGVNRFAECKSADLDNWLATGKWKRRDFSDAEIAEKNEERELEQKQDEIAQPKRRGRPKKKVEDNG